MGSFAELQPEAPYIASPDFVKQKLNLLTLNGAGGCSPKAFIDRILRSAKNRPQLRMVTRTTNQCMVCQTNSSKDVAKYESFICLVPEDTGEPLSLQSLISATVRSSTTFADTQCKHCVVQTNHRRSTSVVKLADVVIIWMCRPERPDGKKGSDFRRSRVDFPTSFTGPTFTETQKLKPTERGMLGHIADTTKPLSQFRITAGFRLTHIDGERIAKVVKSNIELKKKLVSGNFTILKFKPPPSSTEEIPFGGQSFYRLFTDGGRKSPHSKHGEAGCGFVIVKGPFKNYRKGMIVDSDGTVVDEGCAYLGKGPTVNMAEYMGLLLGLRRCLEMGITRIQHMCDSKLVVGYETKSAPYGYNLWNVHTICKRFHAVFDQLDGGIVTTHTMREGNSLADRQANEAIAFQGPRLTGTMSKTNPETFPGIGEIAGWQNMPLEPPVAWDLPGDSPEPCPEPGYESSGSLSDSSDSVSSGLCLPRRLRFDLCNEQMRVEIREAMRWFEETVSDDDVAHWDGWALPFVHESCRSALIRVFDAILSRLPQRESGQEESGSFTYENWKEAYSNAPGGSGAGPDGLPPDVLHQLIAYDESFGERLFQYHSYVAHGKSQLCTEQFVRSHKHDEWARLLYVVPRWLLHAKPGNPQTKVNARTVRDRVELFFSGEWEKLNGTANRALSVPNLATHSIEQGAAKRAIQLVKSHGEIARAAACVKEPCWSICKQDCDKADPSGGLWGAVTAKVESLHPKSKKADKLTECNLRNYNKRQKWGNGGLSERIAHIHFAATMTLLLKPRGKDPEGVYDRLMDDWRNVDDREWTVRRKSGPSKLRR